MSSTRSPDHPGERRSPRAGEKRGEPSGNGVSGDAGNGDAQSRKGLSRFSPGNDVRRPDGKFERGGAMEVDAVAESEQAAGGAAGAMRLAATEGLDLERSDSASGFRGVCIAAGGRFKAMARGAAPSINPAPPDRANGRCARSAGRIRKPH